AVRTPRVRLTGIDPVQRPLVRLGKTAPVRFTASRRSTNTLHVAGSTVNLNNIAGTGLLMQPINILGNDAHHAPRPFQSRKSAVAGIRLRQQVEKLTTHLPGLFAHLGRFNKTIEGEFPRIVSSPNAAGGSEVGYPRLGRYPGAGESDNVPTIAQYTRQASHIAHECRVRANT